MNCKLFSKVLPAAAIAASSSVWAIAGEDGAGADLGWVNIFLPSGSAQVIDPTQSVAGSSQLALSEQWAQWALGAQASSNPILDTTGAFANTNNTGPVFFVAGSPGGTIVRSFNVPQGKPIFFPIINAFDLEVPADNCNLSCAFSFIPYVGNVAGLNATLDGQNLLTFPSFRQTSTSFFTVNVPESLRDAFGFPAQYVGNLDAVSDGYFIALSGLTPGPHTLSFGGAFPDAPFSLQVTANINVTTVPEPHTYALLLAGLGLVGWNARRAARRKIATESART